REVIPLFAYRPLHPYLSVLLARTFLYSCPLRHHQFRPCAWKSCSWEKSIEIRSFWKNWKFSVNCDSIQLHVPRRCMIKGRIHTTGGSCVPEMQRYLKSSSSNTTCEYYLPLCTFALNLTGSHESARDAVQEVFYRIWKNRGDIQIDHSIRAWLYKPVRNQALNMIEQQRSRL